MMNDKTKNRVIFILSFIIIAYTGYFIYRGFQNRASTITDSELITEIRRIDNVIESIGQQFRTGIDNIQTGITELKGLNESTGKRTDNITAGINRLEKGTGKAIEHIESVNEGFSRIENIIGEMGRITENQGLDSTGFGADIRKQVEILQTELGIESVGNRN